MLVVDADFESQHTSQPSHSWSSSVWEHHWWDNVLANAASPASAPKYVQLLGSDGNKKQLFWFFPRSRDTWLTAIAFCDAKFKVWAKHAICGPSPASLTALTMFLALSVVTAMVLGFSIFRSVTVSCSFSANWVLVCCSYTGHVNKTVFSFPTQRWWGGQ